MYRRFRHLAPIAVLVALLVASCGNCRSGSEAPAPDTSQSRPTFSSEKAPYSVTVPAGWILEKPQDLNPHADLAASRKGRHFLIVIPQKLPDIEGVDRPGAEALKEATVERMKKNVDDFEIEQEGPVSLEHGDGISLFTQGVVAGNKVQYVALFITHGEWGYQIIAWGPANDEAKLVDAVDAFIGGWQFRDGSSPGDRTDAGSSAPSEQ